MTFWQGLFLTWFVTIAVGLYLESTAPHGYFVPIRVGGHRDRVESYDYSYDGDRGES